ncbi:MAG TPA: tRNA dihydrouridine synthase DusB [Thermoanaerobaculia bacterium]|nr:tRNA dihydrouridine synthase DusB [Thermoanaerobaculia bacterium]
MRSLTLRSDRHTVVVDPPLLLAPMAGVTDRDFRLLVRRIGGVGLVAMEFISSRAIVDGNRRTRELMHFVDEERPLAIQIYGSDARTMAEAARIVEDLGPDVCDINMGCPANKVLKGCAGAALMGDLKLAADIIEQVRAAITLPLTVKFRLGLDTCRKNYVELGRICQDQGVAAVSLHGRTAKQMFRGEADWSEIARLKDAVDIPVIGNGDVRGPEDAERMLRETGCDGVMIGRGATRNPWVFRQIAAHLSGGAVSDPTLAERRDLMLEHFRWLVERETEVFALHKLRTFTGYYTHGLPNGKHLRVRIQQLRATREFLCAVEEFFAEALEQKAA